MKITLEKSHIGYEIVAADGRSVLVQTDWDYPGVAESFGWSLRKVQKGRRKCDHSSTDGTIDCRECGVTPSEFITEAAKWLRNNIRKEVEDPGYFDVDENPARKVKTMTKRKGIDEVWVASGGFRDSDASFGLIIDSRKYTKAKAEKLWAGKELEHLKDSFESADWGDDVSFSDFVEDWWWTGFFLERLGEIVDLDRDEGKEVLDDLRKRGWAYSPTY